MIWLDLDTANELSNVQSTNQTGRGAAGVRAIETMYISLDISGFRNSHTEYSAQTTDFCQS